MSKRLAVSKAAQSDINHIYDYTLATWGPAQADDYITQLEHTLNAAAVGDKALPSFSEWRPNARYFFVGKHTVFLLDEGTELLVVPVLYQNSEYTRHLARV